MIVRIQQFQVTDAERFAGWADVENTGQIRYAWPAGTNAFEVSILDADELQHAVATGQRRVHLRAAIAPVAMALKGEHDDLVARLDGPIGQGELLSVCKHLTDEHGFGRYAISRAQKLQREPNITPGSVRIETTESLLAGVCNDPAIGIDRGVRLRIFCVQAELVNPLLDTDDLDDERWPEILPRTGFVLHNTHGLDALHVLTRMGAEEFSQRLNSRLSGQVQSSIKSSR